MKFWRGRDLGIVYAIIVTVFSLVVAAQPAGIGKEVIRQVSTNLDNLRDQPLAVLGLSAFVVSPLYYLVLLIPVVIAYGELQRWLGRLAVVITVIFGHVGGTLCAMVAEISAVAQRLAPVSISGKSDVGVSYGLAAALGILLMRVPIRFRVWYGLASLAVVVAMIIFRSPFSAIGHGSAWLIGVMLTWLVYAGSRAPRQASASATASASTSGADK
jgi:hypothetical protein